VSNGSRHRLSRGDRRRNEKLAGLRAVITRESAVLAFDLAADKQVCVLTDQDSKVLARRTVRCKAWELSEAVSWGLARAAEAGFTHVVVACEPTGHRWRVLDQITAELGVRLVCVGPLLVHRAREAEDFTRNKNDDTDAMIIARLVTELRCYLPERADSTCARTATPRGAPGRAGHPRRRGPRCRSRAQVECAWPAVLGAASDPLESKSWLAAVTVALDRIDAGGDLSVIRRWGWTRFAAAVRRELGATRWYSAIVRAVFDAATDPAHADVGVSAQRAGALERVASALADLAARRTEITEVEARMLGVLGHLGLTELVTTIPGSPRSARSRSWPSPVIPPGSARPGPWSNTPGSARVTTPRAPTRARPASAAAAAPSCASPPGARYSPRYDTTRSWPPATPTSPAARTTRSPTPRPASRSRRACCANCTPSS